MHYLEILCIYLPTFFSTRTGRTTCQTAATSVPKHVLSCKEVPFGGLVDTLPLGGKTHQFWGPKIRNHNIKKIANNSKTVRDREKKLL